MFSERLIFQPPVIAHRGARARAPENTMAAFRAAREDGALWIETDVKLTADGIPILIHDETLDRTTDGTGAVADKSWEELQNLDAGKWFGKNFAGTRIPSLEELLVFARDSDMSLNLELKPSPGHAKATAIVTLIEAAKIWPPYRQPPLISSSEIECLTAAAQMHPDWPRGLLLDEWREDWRELVALTGATTLNINADLLTPERLPELLNANMPVLTFTVNDPERARALIKNGVSAVFSDDPAAFIRA